MKNSFFPIGQLFLLCLILGLLGCHRRPSIIIDESIVPSVSELPGLDGGPSRPVGVVIEPDSSRTEFPLDEVLMVAHSQQDLDDFLTKYNGVVVRAGRPGTRPYLIRVDIENASFNDLARKLAKIQKNGTFAFSSEKAAKLVALVVREASTRIVELNLLLQSQASEEHPDDFGDFIDWENLLWMTEDDNNSVPGDQGLSIGIARAWKYLEYKGIPTNTTSSSVAIIDGGFALNENTGFPTGGNLDFTQASDVRPLQVDLIDGDLTAGGENPMLCGGNPCQWHGTNVFAVTAARNSNHYGGAGTGSNFTSSILFKVDGSLGLWSEAIYKAVDDFNVDVINMSMSRDCALGCDIGQFIGIGPAYVLGLATGYARGKGTIVVVAAGNDSLDLATKEIIPATFSNVICVGAINFSGANKFNYGSSVDIWAPTGILSTVTPKSALVDSDNVGIDELARFGGTSASAPFVSGIVALMKALDDSINLDKAIEILQNTANFNTADVSAGPAVTKGWVDAFRAVESVSPNQPPIIKIIQPSHKIIFKGGGISFNARVIDPELEARGLPFNGELVFRKDGVELCRSSVGTGGFLTGCLAPPLAPGVHQITATAVDIFGAVGSTVMQLEIINNPPFARIDFPKHPETSFCSDQELCFTGSGHDFSEILPVDVKWTTAGGTVLGNEEHFCTTLTEGSYDITLTVADNAGISVTDHVSLTILPPCGRPSGKILNPAHSLSFNANVPITFEGIATDPEDGPLPDKHLIWFSNIDGKLGEGSSITTTLSSPFGSIFIHKISLVVTDSAGNEEVTDEITLFVGSII